MAMVVAVVVVEDVAGHQKELILSTRHQDPIRIIKQAHLKLLKKLLLGLLKEKA